MTYFTVYFDKTKYFILVPLILLKILNVMVLVLKNYCSCRDISFFVLIPAFRCTFDNQVNKNW